MVNKKENPSEKIFSKLCAKQYLKGFVFHSPKYNDPTEKEAGDILLWLRNMLIVFEVVWRDPSLKGSTKQFIKRIGEKRKQLEKDFIVYSSKGEKILLTNEEENKVSFKQDCFHSDNFIGVIVVDCESFLENIHYQSYNKAINTNFPICIITKNDFVDLLIEIDTIPDLLYYFKDRHNFVKSIYNKCPQYFINLNRRIERDLIALYKRKENKFEEYNCKSLSSPNIWRNYRSDFCEKIKNRDKENEKTKIIDLLTDYLLKNLINNDSIIEFSWEIGVRSRRERVLLAEKISISLDNLKKGTKRRQFAFYSQTTGCWSVFYFQYGENEGKFENNLAEITQLKLFKEKKENSFQHSVFGYGFFRASGYHNEDYFNEIGLWVEDADTYLHVPKEEYEKSLKYFGNPEPHKIEEFPKNKI